ncbi:MAG: AAA family ATPase [Actinobacteria bacterium]|nr:AAA family ATPase [Actinomycetota bacterium]MBU4302569.1 AAA family ATPase [Actinomycetota bacterium]MBU4385744.1 AAA family ATPase [Actinomycetota bacterium]MCG2795112.1 AAA family ATPase [Actinomycetes bacterium]
MILAVCGKGGVGKTTISAVAAATLRGRDGVRGLMVDGDPAGGLGMALSLEAPKSLNDVRKEVIGEVKAGERSERDLAVSMDYLLAEALAENGNLAFLSIGRPEDVGCYCRVNSFLKAAIEGLAGGFDMTVIDAEAGIEQVNRKVMATVDYVLLVSDTSAKGVRVAETIKQVADTMVEGGDAGLVLNRVRDESEVESIRRSTSLEVIGWIPEDDTIRGFDENETSFFELPECPARVAIVEVLEDTGLL